MRKRAVIFGVAPIRAEKCNLVNHRVAIKVHPKRFIDMKQLSTDEFMKYIDQAGQHYLVNPRQNLAFRSFTKDGESHYFCKTEGGQEKEIRHDDEYYNEAWLFSMVLTKEEYDQY